jgi:NADH:ubiquinone oxidoreductase subunit
VKSLMTFITQIFTWWNGQTLGTRFWTWRKGELVGQDEFGNTYYRARNTPLGERRWVIYNGYAEASAIPSGWHGWMHHTVDVPPSEEKYAPNEWQQPSRPNPTGTANAYRPKGSALGHGRRERTTGDYEAWTPGG